MNPYKATKETIEELHNRSQQKLKQLFPEGTDEAVQRRMKREMTALTLSPYIYALLIAEEVFKTLREHRFSIYLEGEWFCCYYAWLLGLTEYDPLAMAQDYRNMGLWMKQFIGDQCVESPLEIAVSPNWAKPACLELLRLHAQEWGFWLYECPDGGYKLINLNHRPDDMYAAGAPVIRIVDSNRGRNR